MMDLSAYSHAHLQLFSGLLRTVTQSGITLEDLLAAIDSRLPDPPPPVQASVQELCPSTDIKGSVCSAPLSRITIDGLTISLCRHCRYSTLIKGRG